MRVTFLALLFAVVASALSGRVVADESISLMKTISKWSYPECSMNGAVMSDGATMDGRGNRTVPSIVCKTMMTTEDSVQKVVSFYKGKLTPEKDAEDKEGVERKEGRSVVISDDSEGRPFVLQTILVNTSTTSTTLIISRAAGEDKTHIHWKHYMRL